MFTKTGLRPTEVHGSNSSSNNRSAFSSLPARPGIGKKSRPIVARPYSSTQLLYISGSGVVATARMRRDQWREAPSKINNRASARPTAAGVRLKALEPTSAIASGGAGRVLKTAKRGASRGRKSGVGSKGCDGGGEDASRGGASAIRRRPEWDDSLRDASQYRLTPEEAARRKKCLVSKHNTLVFGLGKARVGATATATTPEDASAAAAARARSATRKRSSEQQAQKVPGEQPVHFRRGRCTRSSGGTSTRRGGKKTMPPVVSVGHDLTASAAEEEGAEVGGVNDLTVGLFEANDNGNNVRRDDGPASAGSASAAGPSVACGSLVSSNGGNGDVSNTGGTDESESPGGGVDALGLAGIEVGIKAFSERVWRLETYRRAGLAASADEEREIIVAEAEGGDVVVDSGALDVNEEEQTSGADRTTAEERTTSGEESTSTNEEEENQRRRLSDSSAYSSNPSANPGDVEVNELFRSLCRTTANDNDDDDNDGPVERRRRGDQRANNPWRRDKLGGDETLRTRENSGARESRAAATELVERIQLWEAQVTQNRLPPPPPGQVVPEKDDIEAAGDDNDVGTTGKGGTRRTNATGDNAQAVVPAEPLTEDTQVVITGLLSLTTLLRERVAVAERRLRHHLAGGSATGRGDGESTHNEPLEEKWNDVDEAGRLLRARARSIIRAGSHHEALRGKEKLVVAAAATASVVPSDDVGTNNSRGRRDMSSDPANGARGLSFSPSSLEAASPCLGRSRRRVKALQPPSMTSPASFTAKDCWGEALDAVGKLVDGPIGGGKGVVVSPGALSSSTPRRPVFSPATAPSFGLVPAYELPPSPAKPAADATPAAAPWLTPIRAAGSNTNDSLWGRPSPPPSRVACDSARRWGARDALTPLNTLRTPVAGGNDSGDGGGNGGGNGDPAIFFSSSRLAKATQDGAKEEVEEDSRPAPILGAPTPAMKPQHPFGGNSPIQSPWRPRQQHVGRGQGVDVAAAPAFTVGGGASSAGQVGGGGGGGDRVKLPAIGQWYTPNSQRLRE